MESFRHQQDLALYLVRGDAIAPYCIRFTFFLCDMPCDVILRRQTRQWTLVLVGLCSFLVGCSLFGEDDARVRFRISQSEIITSNEFEVTFSDGRSQRRLSTEDFPVDSTPTRYFDTAASGSLRVAFTLNQSGGDRLANGNLQLDLREDWKWSVRFRADSASHDPLRDCMGCFGYCSFPIDTTALEQEYPSSPDSIYVVWGGNTLDNDRVY